jgi:ribonuclease P protein component
MASLSGCAPPEDERSSPGAAEKDASVSPSESSELDQRFPRSRRLTTRRQFLAVYNGGTRRGASHLALFGLLNSVGNARLGITVPKKVGNAVRRNRIKRVLRDVFRRHRASVTGSLDLVVNAFPKANQRTTQELETEFLDLIRRIQRRDGNSTRRRRRP